MTRSHFCSYFLFALLTVPFACAPATANEPLSAPLERISPSSLDISKPLSIDDCIRIALVKSPYLKVDSLGVDIKKLDAEDEWYRMFPKINLYLAENLPVGGKVDKGPSTSIALISGNYDPITAYLKHDAALIAIELAKYAKLQTIENVIQRVLEVFIHQEAFNQTRECDLRLKELTDEEHAFVEKMYPESPVVPLEARFTEYARKQLDLDQTRLKNKNINMLIRAKRLFGIPAEQKIDLLTQDIDQNIFSNFDPRGISYEQIRAGSLSEKMSIARNKLAEAGVKVAWSSYVPKFSLQVRAPDPINNDSTKDDNYYLTLGMTLPILYWGEQGRGRDRAKLNQERTRLSNEVERLQKEDEWYFSRAALTEMAESVELAKVDVDIKKTAVRRAEILFNSGQATYQDLIKEKIKLVRTEKHLIALKEAYYTAKLSAFKASGGLLRRYLKIEDRDENAER